LEAEERLAQSVTAGPRLSDEFKLSMTMNVVAALEKGGHHAIKVAFVP
jgi:hypothetical protein